MLYTIPGGAHPLLSPSTLCGHPGPRSLDSATRRGLSPQLSREAPREAGTGRIVSPQEHRCAPALTLHVARRTARAAMVQFTLRKNRLYAHQRHLIKLLHQAEIRLQNRWELDA